MSTVGILPRFFFVLKHRYTFPVKTTETSGALKTIPWIQQPFIPLIKLSQFLTHPCFWACNRSSRIPSSLTMYARRESRTRKGSPFTMDVKSIMMRENPSTLFSIGVYWAAFGGWLFGFRGKDAFAITSASFVYIALHTLLVTLQITTRTPIRTSTVESTTFLWHVHTSIRISFYLVAASFRASMNTSKAKSAPFSFNVCIISPHFLSAISCNLSIFSLYLYWWAVRWLGSVASSRALYPILRKSS